MNNWKPITTQEELDALDGDLILAGYRAGLKDQPDYTQREQAYWHGYMNGQVDTGRMPISEEQRQLCRNTFKETFRQIFGTSQ
jgi:hypothetical protein